MPLSETLPTDVQIIEVGPRDGLQRERTVLSAAEKVGLIADLAAAGLKRIQVTSFVHPRRVPQMADAEQVCAALPILSDISFSALVLNLRGIERAHAAGIRALDVSLSASDEHSRRNANRSVAQALTEYDEMVALARASDMTVRSGIQCAFGYQRPDDVEPAQVLRLVEHLLRLDVGELALADSSGMANPKQIAGLVEAVVNMAGTTPVILHLHDTRGMGLANVLAALECGIRHFDTAFGGLGGCPFIDGAAGNIPTEDTVFMLEQMGIHTGVDPRGVAAVSGRCAQMLGRSALPGKLYPLLLDD